MENKNVIDSIDTPYLEWQIIVPETIGEGISEWAEEILRNNK